MARHRRPAPGRTRWLMSRDALVSMRRARLMANSAQNRPALSASPTARTPPCQSVSFASVASPWTVTVPRAASGLA